MTTALIVLLLATTSPRGAMAAWVDHWASVFEVPAAFARAVVAVESGWQPHAISDKGAAGLMQLMPATASRFGVRDRFDIVENTRGGVAYLAELWRLFDRDWRLAAAGYYTGEKRVLRYGLALSDPDVYCYVTAVGAHYRRLLAKGERQ